MIKFTNMKVLKRYSGIGGGIHKPEKIVIHAMSEYINGMYADEFLKSVGLSAHFLLCPDGSFIKLRSTHSKAWHAKNHNTGAIGIEVLVEGSWTYDAFLERIEEDWVKESQMNSLIEMVNGIMEYYEIGKENVVRHSDIDPKRKYDPGSGFDWDYFKSKLI